MPPCTMCKCTGMCRAGWQRVHSTCRHQRNRATSGDRCRPTTPTAVGDAPAHMRANWGRQQRRRARERTTTTTRQPGVLPAHPTTPSTKAYAQVSSTSMQNPNAPPLRDGNASRSSREPTDGTMKVAALSGDQGPKMNLCRVKGNCSVMKMMQHNQAVT
jgi:hypothetical protein